MVSRRTARPDHGDVHGGDPDLPASSATRCPAGSCRPFDGVAASPAGSGCFSSRPCLRCCSASWSSSSSTTASADAKWLSDEEKRPCEREIAAAKPRQGARSLDRRRFPGRPRLVDVRYLLRLRDGPYGLTFWMPTLVKATGVTGQPQHRPGQRHPLIVRGLVMILFGRSADRIASAAGTWSCRRLPAAVGFVVVAAASDPTIAIIPLASLAAACITCAPLFWSLPTAFLGARRRGGHRADQLGRQPCRLRQSLSCRLPQGSDRRDAGRHVRLGCHPRARRNSRADDPPKLVNR